MRFWKMQGIGNDFIVVDAMRTEVQNPGSLAQHLCRRRFGIGADGLILLMPGEDVDAMMRIYNADGSEAEMCGNGIRCAARFLYDNDICRRAEMRIDTLCGVKPITLTLNNGQVTAVTVDMGTPVFTPERIPVAAHSNRIQVELDGRPLRFFCVSMGNPHAVTFDCFPNDADFQRFGPLMESHPLFPRKANIEFCRVDNPQSVTVRVWERGDGPTLACGTGSCAVLAAAASLGRTGREAEIHLPGGTLVDRWAADGRIYMTGPAEAVYRGEFEA